MNCTYIIIWINSQGRFRNDKNNYTLININSKWYSRNEYFVPKRNLEGLIITLERRASSGRHNIIRQCCRRTAVARLVLCVSYYRESIMWNSLLSLLRLRFTQLSGTVEAILATRYQMILVLGIYLFFFLLFVVFESVLFYIVDQRLSMRT